MNRIAIIDLGTNTFHLLIVDINAQSFTEIYRERIQVYLAEEGIEFIGDKALKRALQALDHFKGKIDEFYASEVIAFATAGFRKASNSSDLQEKILNRTGIKIEVISGDREASLIFQGVSMAVPLAPEKDYLIMDIGGGSVEFIIVRAGESIWAKSFEIGVAILFQKFNQVDPITESAILDMEAFLEAELDPLLKELKKYKIFGLLGASGSFEVVEGMVDSKIVYPNYSVLEVEQFNKLCSSIIKLSYEERLLLDKLPSNRANLVVSGILLMRFILSKSNTINIFVSQYALKEGIIKEFLDQSK